MIISFPEFTEFSESYAPFRKGSNIAYYRLKALKMKEGYIVHNTISPRTESSSAPAAFTL